MDTAIAWLGLGSMGTPMARRLLDHGYPLTVWNRSPQRTTPLAGAGAQVARSPAAAAANADIVITMVSDADALDGVLFGDKGALAGLKPDGVLVQMSTIGPQAVREIAGKMPPGRNLVDAPVVGSTPAATAGSLTILAGGSPGTLDRIEPILSELGTVRRAGELGSGSALKLVVNTALMSAVIALAEAVTLAQAVGVSREAALAAMQAGPMSGVVNRVTGVAQFSISLAEKDLRLALAAAGLPLPLTEAAADRMKNAIRAGLADKDIAALV